MPVVGHKRHLKMNSHMSSIQIEDPSDPSSRSAAEKEEFAHFKREVYQKVLKTVFHSLKRRSQNGETHHCADGINRVLYPGILIESQDAEEAAYFCGCRAASANHPCPKCLVAQTDLHKISGNFELRTPQSMRAVLTQASKAKTKGAKEKILKDNGMHNIEHFLWDFRFSDPYRAYSYDTLHSDDLGKWGKHLWVLLLNVLEEIGAKGKAFYDILKSIKMASTSLVYRKCCADVSLEYGKSFDFLKQHAAHHVAQDICEKGTVDNFSTRTGEGFQQEAAQAFDQTNMKGAEHQMCIIDEKQEAIARIRMAIDNDKMAHLNLESAEDIVESKVELDPELKGSKAWRLGSQEGKKMNFRVMVADLAKADHQYHHLDERLRDFIACNLPEEAVQMRFEDDIYAQRYKCVVLKYQSLEDWTEGTDFMRCNPKFHGRKRFDCVIIHDDAPKLSVARLCDLFRCWLPSGNTLDIALIHRLSSSKWKPKTMWDGCRVLDEEIDTTLVQMDYLLRGALVCPVSDRAEEKSHYFMDSVDPDIFLRENS
ncbi:hypothetical protein BYT27DRAFT_7106963 [Phlegmacium glaucopus]|nr:hypothetical protein BYT27DRAFT_7106963 [Phlegmacium glaucopus]